MHFWEEEKQKKKKKKIKKKHFIIKSVDYYRFAQGLMGEYRSLVLV